MNAPYVGRATVGADVVRDVATLCLAVATYGAAFGVLGGAVGLPPVMVVVISLLVYAGGAQMALLGVLAAGGAPLAGAASGLVINSRLVAFGAAAAPLLGGSRLRRLAAAYLITDEAVTLALAQSDAAQQRQVFWFAGPALWLSWQASTLLGVLAGGMLGDPAGVGLDAAFPAAFLVLIVPLLRGRAERAAAVGGGVGALIGLQLLPAGLPVLLAMATGLGAALVAGRGGGFKVRARTTGPPPGGRPASEAAGADEGRGGLS